MKIYCGAVLMVALLALSFITAAQPKDGDVFREYALVPSALSEKVGFLRVGGKLDYRRNPDGFPKELHDNGHIFLPFDMEMDDAVKVEVILEKLQSHDDTKGLRMQINGHDWIQVADASNIPQPMSSYMHHYYPVTEVPVDQFSNGSKNTIQLEVDSVQAWNWPQNIFYGIIFRVYYDQNPDIGRVDISTQMTDNDHVSISLSPINEKVEKVEYVGKYENYNYEGDGVYDQWHYYYREGKFAGHIGTATTHDLTYSWDMAWVPDQKNILLGARMHTNEGLIAFVEQRKPMKFPKRDFEVRLIRPTEVPANWVTRNEAYEEKVILDDDVNKAVAFELSFVSWSPGYMEGLYLNGKELTFTEGPKYDYYIYRHVFTNVELLKAGVNTIGTGLTPLHDGQMVHGMEVQWPGIMMKVKYKHGK